MAALAKGGGHAEYVAVDQSLCVAKPESISYEECAGCPVAATSALQALRDIGKRSAAPWVFASAGGPHVGSDKLLADLMRGGYSQYSSSPSP